MFSTYTTIKFTPFTTALTTTNNTCIRVVGGGGGGFQLIDIGVDVVVGIVSWWQWYWWGCSGSCDDGMVLKVEQWKWNSGGGDGCCKGGR